MDVTGQSVKGLMCQQLTQSGWVAFHNGLIILGDSEWCTFSELHQEVRPTWKIMNMGQKMFP